MSNNIQNLNDDMVKLVAYSIVSVRRGDERILNGGEGSLIVTGRMSAETFTSYIIGRYLQTEVKNDKEDALRELIVALDRYLGKAGDGDTRRFAEALKRYLNESLAGESTIRKIAEKKYRQIPETDRKYLRVYYVVSNRWPREPKKFEEEQIAVLEEISQAIGGNDESRATSL